MKEYLKIFKNKSLLCLWIGQILSQSGTRMYQIALSWWIVTSVEEQSGLWMGILLVLSALPSIFFVSKIGHIVDINHPKKILINADLIAALSCFLLILVVYYQPPTLLLIFFTGFVLATCQAFLDPALNKSVSLIAGPEVLGQAVAIFNTTTSIANITGACLGAIVIGTLGLKGTLILNASSYVLGFIFSQLANYKNVIFPNEEENAPSSFSAWKEFSDQPFLQSLLLSFGVINFFATPIFVVMPIFIRDVIKGSSAELAFAEVGLWLGYVAGSFLAQWVPSEKIYVKIGGLFLFLMGLSFTLSSMTSINVYFTISLFLAGMFVSAANVKFVHLFHSVVEINRKGKFFALLSGISSFTFPISFLLFGFLSDHLDTRILLLVQGIGVMFLSFWYLKVANKENLLWA